jgi:putative copper resistance protein D
MDELRIAFRAAHFAAGVALFGELAFFFCVARPVLPHAHETMALELRRRLHRVTAWSLVVLVVSGIAWFVLQAAAMSGSTFSGALQLGTLDTVLTETSFGRVWQIRFALAIALGAAIFLLRRAVSERTRTLLGACGGLLAGALLATLAWAGHGAAEQGADRSFHLAADGVHLLAAGAWLGALAPLAFALLRARMAANDDAYQFAAAAARRFSALGIACVSALLLTGTINAWYTVGSLPALVGTYYGRLLLVKLALFGAMICFAAVNRMRLTPRLARRTDATRTLRQLQRNAIAEAALGLCVLGIVGALGIAVPASHLQPVWPFAYSLSWQVAESSAETLAVAWIAALGAALSFAMIVIGAAKGWRKTTAAGAAGLSIGLALSAWWLAVPAFPTSYFHSPIRFSAEPIARGRALFGEHCALCHGPEGRGDGPAAASLAVKPADLAEHFFHHREGDILWKLKHGAAGTPMPAFGGRLSEEQLWQLITLLRAQAEAEAGGAMNESVEDSRAIVAPDFTFQVGREPQDSLARQRGAAVLLVFYMLPGSQTRLRTLTLAKGALELAGVRIIAFPLGAPAGASAHNGEIDPSILANPDPNVVAAYRLFGRAAETARQAAEHFEFLIDRQGYIRARWSPRAGAGWDRIFEFLRQVEVLQYEKHGLVPRRQHVH